MITKRLAEAASARLARRVDRRSFLTRAAVTGSALAVAPVDYLLKPGSAYERVCSCRGQTCPCGSLCCDGYTEFCCTLTGRNTCPSGTIAAGWWKVDGSGFCGSGPRYYLDCNAGCGRCGNNCSGGTCPGSCSGTTCGCANRNCANRKAGCTRFRYGQCGQSYPCLGPIVCRLVTCLPPWTFDASCTRTVAYDNRTRYHNRPCLNTPIGRIESAVAGPGSTVRVRGWALDPNVTGPVRVVVVVDSRRIEVVADDPHPTVARAFPGFGPNHGFDITVPVVPISGGKSATGTVRNAGYDQGDSALPPVTVDRRPFGALESITRVPGGLRCVGWAIDPDNTGPVRVRLSVGPVGSTTTTNTDATADVSRPDVGATNPGYGNAHGFDVVVAAPAGPVSVCVGALNIGPGLLASRIGCLSTTVSNRPFGRLETAEGRAGSIRVAGWAIDPDSNGAVEIAVTVDGVLVPPTARAELDRPDVGAANPGYGSAHGFDVTVPASAGTRTVCVTARNLGAGSAERSLGCRSVTVS